jgi:cobyrinic acid a,c-diamide synthase
MDARECPAVLISAPASGQGKTTVTCALARLLTRRGHRVRAFKCGPDFLDPVWLALATQAPVHSLDLWMTGAQDCSARLWRAAGECDVILLEGVMGLFDGEPSAADLARRFHLPVLTVVDASAMAGTFGAVVHGLRDFQRDLRWAGVLANRVGGERHAQMLQSALRDSQDWLGALPHDPSLQLPERHLGLVAPGEMNDAMSRLDAAADALTDTPIGALTPSDWNRWNVSFATPSPAEQVSPMLEGKTIAIARDAAFCFIYAANVEVLRALGAQIVFFSPMADTSLPACDAVWLPGGYPELHASALSRNDPMAASLREHVRLGKSLWAECGGMMVLFDEIETVDAQRFPMWGLLPGRVTMQRRLAGLGPQQLALPAGVLRGHTFHHSTCATSLKPAALTSSPVAPARPGEALYRRDSLRASYFHAWFASDLRAAASLFLPEGACV